MVELKKLRGKSILVSEGNVVNDMLLLYPELFSYPSIEQVFMEFPENIQFSLTSPDIVYASVGVEYPIKAIRKKSTHRDSAVKITGAQLFVSSNADRALMTILLNPTLSAPLTFTDVANSSVQEANGSNTITVTNKGTVLFSKYITQNSVFDAKVFEQDFLTWLDMSITDVSDVIVVCITPITATISANASINYKDY